MLTAGVFTPVTVNKSIRLIKDHSLHALLLTLVVTSPITITETLWRPSCLSCFINSCSLASFCFALETSFNILQMAEIHLIGYMR